MGWICKRCGSENDYGSMRCAACRKWTGPVGVIGQRMTQSRLRRLGDASVNSYLDEQVAKEQRFLKKMDPVFRKLMLLLVIAGMLLAASQMFIIDTNNGLDVKFNHTWKHRLERVIERNVSRTDDVHALTACAAKGA